MYQKSPMFFNSKWYQINKTQIKLYLNLGGSIENARLIMKYYNINESDGGMEERFRSQVRYWSGMNNIYPGDKLAKKLIFSEFSNLPDNSNPLRERIEARHQKHLKDLENKESANILKFANGYNI